MFLLSKGRVNIMNMKTALRVSLPVLFSVLAFGASAPLALAAGPWYVNASATGTGDGLSPANATTTIQAAVTAAVSGDTINVAAGPYAENVTINKSLTLMGVGSGTDPASNTIINGNIYTTGDTVIVQSLKIVNSNPDDGGVNDYGVKVTAGKAVTLKAVTIDVLHDAVVMRNVSPTDITTIIINNSNIKGYGALYFFDPAVSLNNTNADVNVTVNNTSLIGVATSYGDGFNDSSTIRSDYVDNIHITFTGASSVANEYPSGATSRERLIWFYYADNNFVTGTPTYTNHVDSTVNANALFVSSLGYVSTIEGQVVASYVIGSTDFNDALDLVSSEVTTIVVGGDHEAVGTTDDRTLNTGVTLRIEANSPATINMGHVLTNNGTIIIETGATFTNNGTIINNGIIRGAGTITGTVVNNNGTIERILTYTAGAHGSLIGVTPQTVNDGASGTEVTAVADTGYHFTSWSDALTTNPRMDTGVTGNVSVTANFGANSVSSHGGGGPSCPAGTAYNPVTSSCTPVGQVLGASTGPATAHLVGCVPGSGDLFDFTSGKSCTISGGRVLGAATFNFTRYLVPGSRGVDVTALQQFLIDGGYGIPAGATGYFGLQTRAAVISFQKARGIAQVGMVGPLTRAELNKGQ